jgi:glycosyltransferase involved in cell wall biosynthesis
MRRTRAGEVRHVIHWFSPLPPARTDIAEYTRRILPALAREAQVILWTDQTSWNAALEIHAEVRSYDHRSFSPASIADVRRSLGILPHATDTVFINIGNNWMFHAGLLELARRMPAVVILHDLVIQEMLLDAVIQGRFPRDPYLNEVATNYGPDARRLAVEAIHGSPDARKAMLAWPGLELVTSCALAIISHSQDVLGYFRSPPPVEPCILDLPFPCNDTASARRVRSGPVRLVQFGHIGPNRRALEILDVLAALRTRLAFRFDIVGEVWDETLLRRKINGYGLEDSVHLHGFLPENRLDALISEAHLIFNLRYPTMGEASGSQLRIWSHAACSVVSNHGWYATLPEGTALKIPVEPEAEREALERLLLQLGEDRLSCVSVGKVGFEHLKAKHSPSLYANEIVRICDQTGRFAQDMLKRQHVQRHRLPALSEY